MYFGFAPEAYFFASRGFAGGHAVFIGRYYSAVADQERTIAQLNRERVPLVVLPDDGADDLREGFALLAAYIDRQYSPAGALALSGERRATVLAHRHLPQTGVDAASGWSCFR